MRLRPGAGPDFPSLGQPEADSLGHSGALKEWRCLSVYLVDLCPSLTSVSGVNRYEGHVGAVQLVVEELPRQVADKFRLDVHRRLLMDVRDGAFGVF